MSNLKLKKSNRISRGWFGIKIQTEVIQIKTKPKSIKSSKLNKYYELKLKFKPWPQNWKIQTRTIINNHDVIPAFIKK